MPTYFCICYKPVSIRGSQNIIHIENVVIVFIVVTIIFAWLARFRQHSPWSTGCVIFKLWVCWFINFTYLRGQSNQWLYGRLVIRLPIRVCAIRSENRQYLWSRRWWFQIWSSERWIHSCSRTIHTWRYNPKCTIVLSFPMIVLKKLKRGWAKHGSQRKLAVRSWVRWAWMSFRIIVVTLWIRW